MSFLTDHILSVLILAPVAGAVLVALTRRENEGLQKAAGPPLEHRGLRPLAPAAPGP